MSEFVHLQNGLVTPVEPFELLLRLEAQGHRLSVTADGEHIHVEPAGTMAPDDLTALRAWKHHCIALLRYTPSDAHLFDHALPFPHHGPLTRRPS